MLDHPTECKKPALICVERARPPNPRKLDRSLPTYDNWLMLAAQVEGQDGPNQEAELG